MLTERRLLQGVVAILALVPICAGGAGVLLGPGFLVPSPSWPTDLDSHFRYLSGIFLALGLTFWATVPAIERRAGLFRLACALVTVGGLARLGSLLAVGVPGWPHLGGLVLELIVVPALALWQTRVAHRYRA